MRITLNLTKIQADMLQRAVEGYEDNWSKYPFKTMVGLEGQLKVLREKVKSEVERAAE